jgi:hypothetical protein
VDHELLFGLSIPLKEGTLLAKLAFLALKEVRYEYYFLSLVTLGSALVAQYLLRAWIHPEHAFLG